MDLQVFNHDFHSSHSSQSKLITISEYDEIAQRLQKSFESLDLAKEALESRENLENLRPKVEEKCLQETVRVQVKRKQKETQSDTNANMMLHIFKVEFTDIGRKGYFLLKGTKGKYIKLIDSMHYVLDRVKLVINKKGELVATTTSSTIIRYFYNRFITSF